jgi:hypothetical protein
MRQVIPGQLWLGNANDASDLAQLSGEGIRAVISLALEELPARLARETVYCRFPLIDGAGNSPVHLSLAINTTASLIAQRIPTIICCSAGMSRSPAIAAAALAAFRGQSPDDCLQEITAGSPCDVSPGLWAEVKSVCTAGDRRWNTD